MNVVIFDMDGTLIDTAKLSVGAVRRAARELRHPTPSAEEIRRAIGWANPEFYFRLFPTLSPAEVRAISERTEALEADMLQADAPELPFPGVRAALEALKARGARLCLASTGDARHVNGVMRQTGFHTFFEALHYGEPDKVEMLSRIRAQHPRARHTMVGDMEKDADAARANGIRSIGAGYGYCDAHRWHLFDDVAHAPEDLLKLLGY